MSESPVFCWAASCPVNDAGAADRPVGAVLVAGLLTGGTAAYASTTWIVDNTNSEQYM